MKPTDDDSWTRQSLMDQIRDQRNAEAWQRYWQTYSPKIRGWCASAGLRGDDLDEVVSMVLEKIVQSMQSGWVYDPQRKYRGWLWQVCFSQVQKFHELRGRALAKATGQTSVLEQLRESPAPEDACEVEASVAMLVENAVERVKAALGETSIKWQCFLLTALENRRGRDVAQELCIKVGLVHQNKSRVAAAIRDELERLRDESQEQGIES